ncbi:Zinc finger, C3HC4 type (RING finger), putative [Trypanosoma equiperdum]|uniref:Zinc finger, C3HC4 type (RING finger), putative n=1 Tax=Trypanosoma equiperdum TaxID=5694 RepID=A0A1G4IBG3_TRYEQ|nr:Zinc finger, C3HC4 type (RING finger), putative [Trypanosoma equiperdum]
MGNAPSFCCCCFPFFSQRRADQDHQQAARGEARRSQFSLPLRRRCGVCGMYIDPVLFDGHREACRENNFRNLRQQQQGELQDLGDDCSRDYDTEEWCVVCFAARRSFAFLPCGHVSCCEKCVMALQFCPLCREPRAALCRVATGLLLQFKCRHCGEIIAPELHDGHREVCGFRMMLLQKGKDVSKEEDGSDGADGPSDRCAISNAEDTSATTCLNADAVLTTSGECVTKSTMQYCIQCHGVVRPLVIMLPCGHRLLCEVCCSGRKTCPVCLQCIESSVKSFC